MAKEQTERNSKWLDDYGITNLKQRQFLTAFAVTANPTAAAEASGVSRWSHWKWQELATPEGEKYRAATAAAKQMATEYLEDICFKRATEGVLVNKWHQGKIVGQDLVKSDLLLIFYMKGAMPNKYRDIIDPTKRDGTVTLEDIVAAANKFTLVPPAEKEKTEKAEPPAAAGA